jgi:hypothetical protein
MMKWMLAAGAAALAVATPTFAQKEGKGGKGGDKARSGQVMKADKGGGHAGHAKQSPKADFAKSDNRGQGKAKADRADKAVFKADRGPDKVRAVKVDDKVKLDRGRDLRSVRFDDDVDVRFAPRWDGNGLRLGFADGCPPGLAKKNNGCLPPGQAKKIVGTRLSQALGLSPLASPLTQWYRDDDRFMYRWNDDDDLVYRIRRDNNLIDALFPMTNRDFYYYPVGMQYPDYYNYYNVPLQYQSFYPDGGDNWYRYGDGAIYMVDPQTRMIQGIAALLTGSPLGVGQPLPPAYGVYNVPLGFRSTYYDTPDAWYRYNDGYIYRVDPATQLVTAVIDALV